MVFAGAQPTPLKLGVRQTHRCLRAAGMETADLMNESEARKLILDRTGVTPQRVVFAKAIILNASQKTTSSDSLIAAVLKANELTIPKQVVIHQSVNPAQALVSAGDALSWSLAAREAIWSLIHGGYLIPMSDLDSAEPSIGWTTVVPGSGGQSSGWRFEELTLPVPRHVRRAPSSIGTSGQFLAEPDLYLHTIGIPNMHPEVSSAFREAVKCFRQELFTAALTMLGKASEGAWLELGASLLSYVPHDRQTIFSKQRTVLEDPMMGTFRKIESILSIFDRQDIFRPVSELCGIKPKELRTVAVWSDSVRDSRNTIHFGVSPSTPNTYEKVAALLIGAAPNVKVLYRLKEAANRNP